MKIIGILQNPIQEYAWGSLTAIPDLLDKPSPAEAPQAELWMGAHPKAPSLVETAEKSESMPRLIKKNPQDLLGKAVVKKFGNQLPYLFKVLAAAKPLSIQAHPNLAQARRGFKAENRAGVPLSAPNRNYKDENHKPECLCALTPFWALNGFRKISATLPRLKMCAPRGLKEEIGALERCPDTAGLKRFFKTLLTIKSQHKGEIIQETLKEARKRSDEDPAFQWVLSLQEADPSDIGVLAPFFLNLICLEPGQAMYLAAGELHAYLDGLGIELMANSDNVLRGGLTPKHVDVPELLRVLSFEEREPDILSPRKISDHEITYDSRADEFVLSVICPLGGKRYTSAKDRSVEILFCTEGKATITDLGNDEKTVIQKGGSVVVPAAVKQYRIFGRTTIYKAAVPV